MHSCRHILTVSFLAFFLAHSAPAKVVYVSPDAPGDGSGSSWQDACTTITAGLVASASGDEVWIKSATYPEAIEMKEGVALYGGFPVDGSPSFDQRDRRANDTIINATGLNTHVVVGADFATLDGFTITGGSAQRGGGVYCENSSPTINGCTIARNTAFGDDPFGVGGGLYCYRSSPTLRGCWIVQNRGEYHGAGVFCDEGSSPTLENCLIIANHGSGVSCFPESFPSLLSCTVAGNVAGAGVIVTPHASVILTNCILWNEGKELAAERAWGVTYCCIEGSYPGEGNFGVNPLFVSPETGDYRLQNGSPCVDRGLASAAPDADIDGNPRPGGDGKVDMGAYESPDEYEPTPPTVYHVRADAGEGGDGLSWEMAFRSIQEGLDAAAPLDEVWVAGGTYREGPEFYLVTDVSLYGGFQGTETKRGERDWNTHTTRIECVSEERTFAVHGAVQGLLDGFTIEGYVRCGQETSLTMRNCKTVSTPSGFNGYIKARGGILRAVNCTIASQAMRGGVECTRGGYVHLTGCRITSSRGNGVYLRDWSSAKLEDCAITNCATKGVELRDDSAATLNNCTITDNSAAGVDLDYLSIASLVNCTITNNGGDGVRNYWSILRCEDFVFCITNCLIAQNGGYGLYLRQTPILVNCTIADNSLGGIYSERGHYTPMYGGDPFWRCDRLPILTNCVLWGENAVEILWKYYQEYYYDDSYYYELDHEETPPRGEGLILSYSCVQDGWPEVGNTDVKPLFVDPASGDYHLQPGSPCIDSASTMGPDLDLDGHLRPVDIPGVGTEGPGAFDMGAYEFGSAAPTPTPTTTPMPTLSPTPTATPIPIPPQLWLLDGLGQVHHLPAPTPTP